MPASSPSDPAGSSRGGGWVLAQSVLIVLMVVLVFLPPYWPRQLSFAGIPIAVVGAVGFVWAARTLGTSLTPYPRPRESGELIVTGPYRFLRHPIYVSGFLFFLGVGLSSSLPATVGAVALGALWRRKAAVEEAHLDARFPEYADYRARVRRL